MAIVDKCVKCYHFPCSKVECKEDREACQDFESEVEHVIKEIDKKEE